VSDALEREPNATDDPSTESSEHYSEEEVDEMAAGFTPIIEGLIPGLEEEPQREG
jgi:hypothetical protein